jgi:4-amino-4-deoxy-L-arabinose transferase-like glycosyltransferase
MDLSRSEKNRTRTGLALLLAAAAVLLFVNLGKEGLTDPDESAYAESVREMAQRGDWLVPHLYGEPLLDKPILFYWAMGASFRVLGENEFAARLPSVLAALALVLVVYRLGRLVHGSHRAGLIAAFSLATSLEFVLMGRAAVTDMFLTAFCALGILCYLETLDDPGRRLLPLAGAACVGLAVLTKGPVGLIIPALVLGIHLAATRSLRRLRDFRPLASLLVIAAVSLPWYAAIGILRMDLVEQFFISGNLGRFLKPEHRSQSPLYYLVVLTIGFLPWSAFLPGAVGRALVDWRRGTEGFQRRLLPALWLLVLLVFFTLAASKLPSYILPALPAAAVLAAGPLETWLRPLPAGKRAPGTGALTGLVLLAAGMALYAWRTENLGVIPLGFKTALLPLCGAGLLVVLFALGALLVGRSRISYFLLLGGNGVLVLSLLVYGFPQLEVYKSSRETAAAVVSYVRPSDGVILYRENHPGFAYYLRRVPDLVHREEDLVLRLESEKRVYALMGLDRYEKLRVRRRELPLYLLRSVGNVVVVTNLPPGESP